MIDDKTMLIAADNPQNRKTYEDLVIRTFFLSNGDVTEVSNALRSLLQTTRISINKAENSITLRDTADKVAIAETDHRAERQAALRGRRRRRAPPDQHQRASWTSA